MKKLITMLIALALCLAPASALAAGDALGLRVLATLHESDGNCFVSPVSLAYALAMAASGARGGTAEALLQALDADGAGEIAAWNDTLAEAGLRWANAAFTAADLAVRPDYIDALRADFDAEQFPLDEAERVNAWVDAHTDHLIDRLIDAVDPTMRLMLVNAVAMDAKWSEPFSEENTWRDVFHAPGSDVEAEFMHATRTMDYAERDGAQCVRLDYEGGGLYMLVILPEDGGVDDVLAGLAESGPGWVGEMRPACVALSLPKLDVRVSNTLSDTLKALGVGQAFADDADFSGISDEPLTISEVLQKVRVQVDERGTRAAAATGLIMKGAMDYEEEPPIEMNVNRPCVVLIAEESLGVTCFAGVVVDPTRA